MNIAIINSSTVITDRDGQTMVNGLNMILPKFCRDWGLPVYTAVYVPRTNKSTKIVLKVSILDNSYIPGAIGYHDTSNNIPYGICFAKTILQRGGVPLYSPNSSLVTIAQVVSHEVFELLIDPHANSWWEIGDGQTLYARETCDPVQGNLVTVNALVRAATNTYSSTAKRAIITPEVRALVSFSDWVLPAWSQYQNKTGPFNNNNTLKAPFALDKGGYVIKIIGGSAGYVLGMNFSSQLGEIRKAEIFDDKRGSKRMSSIPHTVSP
jgi:hypothetical protein